jgi:hypothetical protein
MAYIAGIIIVGLLFFALHYFTELTDKQKVAITAVVFLIVISAIAFNGYNNAKNKRVLDAVMKFNQHGTLKCKGVDVNSTNFSLSVGTYTFIGKKETPFYGQMISVSTCE